MKTTLIITVFNRKEHLRRALVSLLKQSVLPDELIVSDDGSSENIPRAIADLTAKFDFPVKFVTHEHKGFRLAKTRNNAARVSSGDLLIFLDQDLIHTRNLLKTFIENAKPRRFITGMPVWLDKENSEKISEKTIAEYDFLKFIPSEQKEKIIEQFKKDRIYYFLHKLRLTNQPRLRGGMCAINREDFFKINGYDEKFIGWGAEDDDLGRRLYKIGAAGYNPFRDEFAIHIYHEKAVISGKGVREQSNYNYYQQKKKEIKAGKFRADFGLDNPYGDDKFEVIELN